MDLQSALICVLIFVLSAAVLILIAIFSMKEKSYEEALAEQRHFSSGLLGTNQKAKSKEKKLKKAGKKVKEKLAVAERKPDKKSDRADGVDATTKADRPQKGEPVEKMEKLEKLDKLRKTEKAISKPEKPEKTANKPEKLEKTAKELEKVQKVAKQFDKLEKVIHKTEKIVNKLEKTEKLVNRPEKTEKTSNKSEKVINKSEKTEKIINKSEKTEKIANKSEKTEKADKTEKIDKTEKMERMGRVARAEMKKEPSGASKPAQKAAKERAASYGGKAHVEFELTPVTEPPAQQPASKKRGKKDPIHSILLNRDKAAPGGSGGSNAPVTNHFDKIHPKDEFELLHCQQQQQQQQQRDEAPARPAKGKQVQQEQEQPAAVEAKVAKTSKVKQNAAAQVPASATPAGGAAPVISARDKKKKKSEFNTLQQMSCGERQGAGVNVSLLMPLVRKAELSRGEVQALIDLLLNKQHDAPLVTSEWSEGRADPVQRLKRQLADKEKALAEEQQAAAGVQAKLREVRAELNAERSKLLQNCRNLEESLHSKHGELQAVLGKLHALNQKVQQLQAQLGEEALGARKLRDEHSGLQLQRQQLERHLATLGEQQQDADAAFQAQLGQLRAELQEQQARNAQLGMELRTACDKAHADKEMLHDRLRQLDAHLKAECEQRHEAARQLDESRRALSELEHRFSVTHRNEAELKLRCQQHLEEARRLEHAQAQTHEEMSRLQAELARAAAAHKQHQDDSERLLCQVRGELEAAGEADAAARALRAQLQHQEQLAAARLDQLRRQQDKHDAPVARARVEQRQADLGFLRRLFPDARLPDGDDWSAAGAEACLREHLATAAAPDAARLQSQVAHYKTIIDDTEGMLNNLQKHIEQEEITWREALRAKDAELEALRLQVRCQLKVQISELEDRLAAEASARRRLELECEALRAPPAPDKRRQLGLPVTPDDLPPLPNHTANGTAAGPDN